MKLLTGGTFDLFHYGHFLHLQECAKLATGRTQVLIMLVTDSWARSRKGKDRPILLYEERKSILVSWGIQPFNIYPVDKEKDLSTTVHSVRPDIYIYEYNSNRHAHDLALEVCNKVGAEAIELDKKPYNPYKTTTSSIIKKIRDYK